METLSELIVDKPKEKKMIENPLSEILQTGNASVFRFSGFGILAISFVYSIYKWVSRNMISLYIS